ncbi:MAG: hypothetical protein V4500_05220 [Pseudomonadota bacterium]
MTTNVNIHSALSKALRGDVHTFVNGCLQQCRIAVRLCGHFVSAFGVVGFLRVKDEQKSVLIAEASASACNGTQIQPMTTHRQQPDNNPDTKGQHSDNGKVTK